MSLFLGVDLGTTYFKAGVFDDTGRLLGLGRMPVEKNVSDDQCELPVSTFWEALSEAVQQARIGAGIKAAAISALGYSSQANSFLLLDRNTSPLTPLVLWPDRRAAVLVGGRADPWRRPEFLQTTGVGVGSPEFAAYKLGWFRKEQPSLWRKVWMVQTVSDYFTFCLTGVRAGDCSTASLLGLWVQRKHTWWTDAFLDLGIEPSLMSTPLRSGTCVGPITREGAVRVGLTAGTPLVAGGLDHYVAAMGAGLGTIAEVSESTGTVLACVSLNDRFEPRDGTCVGPTHHDNLYYEMAFNDAGASRLDWYRTHFAPSATIPELIALGAGAPPGCDGLRARPASGETGLADVFTNIRETHTPGHFVRAILEANAWSLAGLIDDLGRRRRPERVVATGGGAQSDFWLQLKADILGLEVVQVDCVEPACQGAAWLAAFGSGSPPEPEGDYPWSRVKRRFHPDPAKQRAYHELKDF